MPSLAFIHTVAALVETFKPLREKHLPHWESYSMVDESLLQNTVRSGLLSHSTMRQLARTVFSAEEGGADAIVVTCSTLGEAVEFIRPLCGVPLYRIDEGMAHRAVAIGRRIGVLATLPTTLGPTTRLLERVAREAGATAEITSQLCEGAFGRLSMGDREGHDAIVRQGFHDVMANADVVVLAQASMAGALAGIKVERDVPILNSLDTGLPFVAEKLSAL